MNKKKVKTSKDKAKEKKEREKEETEQTPSVRFRPINFDFGQFRLRPISSEVELAEVEHPRACSAGGCWFWVWCFSGLCVGLGFFLLAARFFPIPVGLLVAF